jgi:hypothetical protein
VRLSPGRWAVLAAVAAIVAGIGATAFACANLATLSLSTPNGRPGVMVTFTGAGFAHPRASSSQPPTPVVVRWRDKDGPILAEATPNRFGSIAATFTVPEATPGTYVILGIQETPRVPAGAAPDAAPVYFPEAGTPARASFEVLAPGAGPVIRGPAAESVDSADAQGQLDSTVWIVLTAAFGAVAMSLFGGGLIAFIHQSRKAKEPATARWIPPGWYS